MRRAWQAFMIALGWAALVSGGAFAAGQAVGDEQLKLLLIQIALFPLTFIIRAVTAVFDLVAASPNLSEPASASLGDRGAVLAIIVSVVLYFVLWSIVAYVGLAKWSERYRKNLR